MAFFFSILSLFLGFHQQSHTLGGSLLPYRFVVNSLLYDRYPMGGTSASTSLMPQLVQAVIPPQHVQSEGINQRAAPTAAHSLIGPRVDSPGRR